MQDSKWFTQVLLIIGGYHTSHRFVGGDLLREAKALGIQIPLTNRSEARSIGRVLAHAVKVGLLAKTGGETRKRLDGSSGESHKVYRRTLKSIADVPIPSGRLKEASEAFLAPPNEG